MKIFSRTIILFIFVLSLISSRPIYPADMAGFNFLRTHVSARASAMAGAFVAIPGDVHAIYFNPAGLATVNNRVASATYLNHVLDFQSGFVGYAQPFKNYCVMGVGINYMDYGTFDETDNNGEKYGTFGASSFVISTAIGKEFFRGASAGIGFKYIRSEIERYTAQAYAVDVGLFYAVPFTEDLNVALTVSNIGQSTSAFIETKEDVPLKYAAGFSKKLAHLPLLLNVLVYKYVDFDFQFALGGEFTLSPGLFLRLGYNSIGRDQRVEGDLDQVAGASVGFGYQWKQFSLDYSLSSMGEIGSLNRLTFSTTL